MSAQELVSGVVQVGGGVVAAPLLVGLVQHWKARLQGRRGPTPLQPYRELRRLWGKSSVSVEGTTIVYRLAPPLVAAALGACVLLVPVSSGARPRRRAGRARAAGAACARPVRGRGSVVGRCQRLLADGGES